MIVTSFIDIEKLIDREVDDLIFEGKFIVGVMPVIARVDRYIAYAKECGYETHVKLVFKSEDGIYVSGFMHGKEFFNFKLMKHHIVRLTQEGRRYEEYTYRKEIKVKTKEGLHALTLQGFNQELISDITPNKPCIKCGATSLGRLCEHRNVNHKEQQPNYIPSLLHYGAPGPRLAPAPAR